MPGTIATLCHSRSWHRTLELGNGYGDLKDKTFRIGHMGDHTEAGLQEMLQLADDAIVAVRAAKARA